MQWTSFAMVPDRCLITVNILPHLISRYQLPFRSGKSFLNVSRERACTNYCLHYKCYLALVGECHVTFGHTELLCASGAGRVHFTELNREGTPILKKPKCPRLMPFQLWNSGIIFKKQLILVFQLYFWSDSIFVVLDYLCKFLEGILLYIFVSC